MLYNLNCNLVKIGLTMSGCKVGLLKRKRRKKNKVEEKVLKYIQIKLFNLCTKKNLILFPQ